MGRRRSCVGAQFEKKFGISWKAALSKGIVFNAVDGCAQLGIDGEQMNTLWAAAKKAGNLVKFGGGFYAGQISAELWAELFQAPPAVSNKDSIKDGLLGKK